MTIEESGTRAYIRGVPHALPPGERVLWEGAPDVRAVARHVFHQRGLAAYLAAMIVLWGVTTSMAVASSEFASALAVRVGLSLVVLFVVETLSRVLARTTWYAITNKRVVLRIGMVIPMSINIPFTLVSSAGAGRFRDGTGQVALKVARGQRLAYVALWPHCRVAMLNHPEPVLRGLTEPQRVGEVLARALAESTALDATTQLDVSTRASNDVSVLPQPAAV